MHNKKLVFGGACVGILLFGAGITTLGSVKQALMIRFGLDEIGAGTLFSILPLGILTGSLLFGPASDKYGYKYILTACCFSMFLGFEGVAYAPTWALLRLSVFLFGLGGGAVNGATSALVADLSDKKKGANLSVLGVFFGIGALGMPLVLGALEKVVSYEVILAVIGGFCFLLGVFYVCIRFPVAKLGRGFPMREAIRLFKDPVLILIAFFLFCQSSLEALMSNWTTTYLIGVKAFANNHALFALSLSVVGMTVMRLLLGSVFRKLSSGTLWVIAFVLLAIGLALLTWSASYTVVIIALMLIGGGLAGGFPLMLGMVGERFSQLSATAFGIVLVVALTGNMLVNYLMGIVVQTSGIQNLTIAIGLEWLVMVTLCIAVLLRINKGK